MKKRFSIFNWFILRTGLLAALFIAIGSGRAYSEPTSEEEEARTKILKEKYGLHEETIRTLEQINRAAFGDPEKDSSPKAKSKSKTSVPRKPATSTKRVYSPGRTTVPVEKKKEKGFLGRLFSKDKKEKTDYKRKAEEEAEKLAKRRAEQERVRKKIEAEWKAREARLAKTSSSKSKREIAPSKTRRAVLPPPARTTTRTAPRPFNALGEPLLRSDLIVKISVYNHGAMEGKPHTHRIPTDGNITMPLVGTINVLGLTLDQLNDRLTEKYRDYLKNPQVKSGFAPNPADKKTMPWGYVTVLGRVKKPGRIYLPVSRSIPLSTAIQSAGGFESSAKTKAIKVTRKGRDGKLDKITKNLQKIREDGQVDDMDLRPNDVVYVPVRFF